MKTIIFATTFILIPFFFVHAQEEGGAIRTGNFKVETTIAEILGEADAKSFESLLSADETIKWSIQVPKNYNPSAPAGIIVHMTDRKLAKVPFGWSRAFENKNLIWISLVKAGNPMPDKEMIIAVLSVPFLQSKYNIDLDRIYIAASTASCLPASAAMQIYPNIFKGAIYSTCEPIDWRGDIPETIEPMKRNGYVFVSSTEKSVRDAMRRIYNKYSSAGISNLEFINVNKLIYGRNMDRRKFTQSIELLDNFN